MTVKKALLIAGGCICTVLGAVGVVLPLMPATPFLILASVCFAGGSERLHRMLISNRFFGPRIERVRTGKGLTAKEKLTIYLTACLFIVPVIILTDSLHLRVFLTALLLVKAAVFIRMKTAKAD
jgi:uncharacterized membrane protein YbaN (DUF454 family)